MTDKPVTIGHSGRSHLTRRPRHTSNTRHVTGDSVEGSHFIPQLGHAWLPGQVTLFPGAGSQFLQAPSHSKSISRGVDQVATAGHLSGMEVKMPSFLTSCRADQVTCVSRWPVPGSQTRPVFIHDLFSGPHSHK